jgi:hypothetical protein
VRRGEIEAGALGGEQVTAEALLQERGVRQVALAGELDRVLYEFDRVRGGTGLAGELGSPGAEFGGSEPSELVRFRHGVPQGEGALEVAEGFGEAEHIPCLAGRVDRSDERLSPSGSTANLAALARRVHT